MSHIKAIPAFLLMTLIKGYRYLISPLIGPRCRFTPTCSEYALESIEAHGFLKGSALTIKRLSKCHPFNSGGYDPVPPIPQCKECR